MAESVPFNGVNRRFEVQAGADEDGELWIPSMEPMHAFQGTMLTYTCWKLSPEELEEINRTGEVWMAARTGPRAMQPHWVGSLAWIKRACADMGSFIQPWKPKPSGKKPRRPRESA